jgi:hypothetical protein
MAIINEMKLGTIDENEFDTKAIELFLKATGVRIAAEDLNKAWDVMNPEFSAFESVLKEAIQFNKTQGQSLVLISFTNPKDIRSLIKQLDKNGIPYKTEGDVLIEIDGIKLLTTYALKKTKQELIKIARDELLSNRLSVLAQNSTFADKSLLEAVDIKYIHGVNNINDAMLKVFSEDFDKTTDAIKAETQKLLIHTSLWHKVGDKKQTLTAALTNEQLQTKEIEFARL